MLPLIDIAAFLLADHGNFDTVDSRKTGDDRRVFRISPIAVDLNKIREDRCKNVQRIRAVRVPSTLNAFERGD